MSSLRILMALFWLLVFSVINIDASASTLNLYGMGAQNVSLGSAGVSLPTDAFSQNYNPALMPWLGQVFSFGIQGAVVNFEQIRQVVVDTPALGASQITVADVNTQTPDTFLATIAYQTPFSKSAARPLYFGAYLTTPLERIWGFDSQDSFQPQYALYVNDTQRLCAGFNFALKLGSRISVGLGGDLFFGEGVTAIMRQPAQGNSTARLKGDVKSMIAPQAGIEGQLDEEGFWRVGVSFHGKEDYGSAINVQDRITIPPASQPNFNFTAQSSFFYDPETYRVGVSYSERTTSILLGADWQRWNGFNGTTMALSYSGWAGTFGQTLPPTPYHDVIVGHLGFEHRFSVNALRFGYTYMPTPVPDQSGESNILDSDRNVFALGFGTKFRAGIVDTVLKFDLTGFVQILNPKQVTKISSQSVGYPGYKIGGTVYGYGTTLTAEF